MNSSLPYFVILPASLAKEKNADEVWNISLREIIKRIK